MATKEVVLDALQLLCANYSKELTQQLEAAWNIALEKVDDAYVPSAMREFLQSDTGRFFPPVGLFYDICKNTEKKVKADLRSAKEIEEWNNEEKKERISYAEWKRRTGGSISLLEEDS